MKRVKFEDCPTIKYIFHHRFAHNQARQGGYWEQVARDRVRFERRIDNVSQVLTPILQEKIAFLKDTKPCDDFYQYIRHKKKSGGGHL